MPQPPSPRLNISVFSLSDETIVWTVSQTSKVTSLIVDSIHLEGREPNQSVALALCAHSLILTLLTKPK